VSTAAAPGPRTAAALAARRRKTEAALQRVHDAITRLRREKAQVSVAAVGRRADVSRAFLYANPEARAAVATAMAQAGEHRSRMLAEQDDEREAAWRERALNAEDALKAAHAEILAQRARIGELLGQVRDLQAEWTQEAIQRITTENATLKQRVRELTDGNRTLDERLKAARSNLRFHDKRIADLEAQIASQVPCRGTKPPTSELRTLAAAMQGRDVPDEMLLPPLQARP
jgi:chromosome segregation ATPase